MITDILLTNNLNPKMSDFIMTASILGYEPNRTYKTHFERSSHVVSFSASDINTQTRLSLSGRCVWRLFTQEVWVPCSCRLATVMARNTRARGEWTREEIAVATDAHEPVGALVCPPGVSGPLLKLVTLSRLAPCLTLP